ncbi:MAG TPA: ABC transporter transmembrane domain-containing protein [Acidimicrobiia bacterium]|jgi:ABC-type multidrug transport system fused ATPase/permease subunit
MSGWVIEIREPDGATRRTTVQAPVAVGREGDVLVVSDERVSRRHLELRPRSDGVEVTDLGSRNGTRVNGRRIDPVAVAGTGDVLEFGHCEILVVGPVSEPAREPVTPPGRLPNAVARDALEDLDQRDGDAATVRFRAGSPAARLAGDVLRAATRARKRLAGLGSEPWGIRPQIVLLDPVADPRAPGSAIADGTFVDVARAEIWMVVTAEAPPEPLERPFALLFGAALPAANDLRGLLEGYGLVLADSADPDPQLRELALPPLAIAEGELGAAMHLSFVRYLLGRGRPEDFTRLLATAQPGRVDAAAEHVYGANLSALENAWRRSLLSGGPEVSPAAFLRLALRYMRPYRAKEVEIFVYMLLGLAFTAIFPFQFRKLIDTAIPSGHFSQVVSVLGVLLAALAVSLVADLRRAYVTAQVSSSVVRSMRVQMFTSLQSRSPGWFSQQQSGDLLSRLFSDVAVLEQGLSQALRDGAFQVLSLVVAATVLLVLNWLLAVIVLVAAPLVALVYKAMAAGAKARSIRVQEQTGAVLGVAAENLEAQPVVKAFSLRAREIARFRRSSDRLYGSELRLQLFGGLFGLSVNLIVTVVRVVVLATGAWLILHHHLTIGGLVAFMGLVGEAITPVTVLTGIGQQVQASSGALARINEIIDAPPEVVERADARDLPPLQREIQLAGVGFSYSEERRILEDIDVRISAGQRVAFVGPTGAGKSSLLGLLIRFYDPTSGAVTFDGYDLRSVTLRSMRDQIGVVFQDTFLFDTTIRENITIGAPDATDEQVDAAIRAAELQDVITELPRGLGTPVGPRGSHLSGGQRQRVAIARALIRDPSILLLDEATSALDPRTERQIARTLNAVSKQRTTIAITHRLTSVVDYDCIFVVADGRIVASGPHDALVREGGLYAALWSEQMGEVPLAPAFDLAAALASIPLFSELDQTAREEIAARARPARLRPGEEMRADEALAIISSGRARVFVTNFAGALVPASELGPGDGYGISALLGQDRESVLRAETAVELLVLDDGVIRNLAARFPSVDEALRGRAALAGPEGVRLPRATGVFAPVAHDPDRAGVHQDGVARDTGMWVAR